MLQRLLFLALVALFSACGSGEKTVTETPVDPVDPENPGPTAFMNPVVRPVAADPSVVRTPDGKFYMFATADNWADGNGTRFVPYWSSTDLVSWTYEGNVFTARPTWKQDGGLWAPDISYYDGKYHLYYAYSTWGDPNPCIGYAGAPTPEGPWTDLGHAVFCSHDIGVNNSIDAFAWNENGKRTLIWGSFNGIFAVELDSTGTRPNGQKVQLTDHRFEAPYVYKKDGYYYLFLSGGSCCEGANSTYHVVVGRSESIDGPYVDAQGTDLRSGGGNLILEGDANWAGPGHNAVVEDDEGTAWIVYHAMPRLNAKLPNGVNRREALIDPLVWSESGWPSVKLSRPGTHPQKRPVINNR